MPTKILIKKIIEEHPPIIQRTAQHYIASYFRDYSCLLK